MGALLCARCSGLRRFAGSRHVRGRLAASDVLLLGAAVVTATYLRYDFHWVTDSWWGTGLVVHAGGVLLLCCGGMLGLYTGHWLRGSFEEARALAVAVGAVTVGMVLTDLALGHPLPIGAVLAAGPILLGAMAAIRVVNRLGRRTAPAGHVSRRRVVVFGAGDGARDVVGAMLRDPECTFEPTALLDDDPGKANLRLHGVPVRGSRKDLVPVAQATGADTLLIAVPSADASLIGDLTEQGRAAGLSVRVLPPVSELLEQAPGLDHIRPVSLVDLLGRREVEVDLESITGYLAGRRVLVTGAGGSIGSELCRQIRNHDPETIVMLDRDESALHELQLSLDGRAMLDDRTLVVADIRDRSRMARVFAEHAPEVVFHTAALKHLPLLEMHPDEALKTNVLGTLNVLSVALEAGVHRFVNISTDKAADPISVLGYSKRIGERLTSWYDAQLDDSTAERFLSVRFGNVLGSRGSVLTAFRRQIAEGRPVTVTHPDVTRYFMTIEEAVRLLIQAGAVGSGGQVLVLDMGKPVRIAEVAQRLIAEADVDVGIVYTGLRSGEKLDECLLGEGERDDRPIHPQISHVTAPALDPVDLAHLLDVGNRERLIAGLREVAAAPVRLPAGCEFTRPLPTASTTWRINGSAGATSGAEISRGGVGG